MKRNSLRYSLMAMVILLAVACQPEVVLPTQQDARQSNDRCKHVATVVEGDCGLYMALENGTKIYTRDTKEVELQAGMELVIGYSFEQSSNHSGGQCGSGCGNGQCGTSSSEESQPDELQQCMSNLGVREAKLSCIRVRATPNDETTG
ncbi:MAG: hypothetical protein AAFO91_16870 [Bacteroidota bacterium]